MSRCGSCVLYDSDGKETYGITCPGNCDIEECADMLQTLVSELQARVRPEEHSHWYKAFVYPQDRYCYPVAIRSSCPLSSEEVLARMRKECSFLVAEDADCLKQPTEISEAVFCAMPTPKDYIIAEYGVDCKE